MMTNDFRPTDAVELPLDGREAPDRAHDGAGDSTTMTRSEERLAVRIESLPVERVRLEKYIVTEERTITVTVSREEVRLVREPIFDAVAAPAARSVDMGAMSDPDAGVGHVDRDVEAEMLLVAEEIVVTKRVVPVERVRLIRDRVTELREVTETVRAEQVDLELLDPVDR